VLTRLLFKIISAALGIALLLAALFLDGGIENSIAQQVTPVNTLSASERLLEPTLPPAPSQADHGAQDYWLYCLPCHGEKGQGLTEEFRQTYPPEETNCWQSGCHGNNPYQYGFKLPTKVPAVIGNETLGKFSDAAQLHSYIRAAMPFWNPGSLSDEESWRITAFLLRENHLRSDSAELNDSNAADVKILRIAFLTPDAIPVPVGAQDQNDTWLWLSLGVALLLILAIFILNRRRIKP
jgi:cytochrome c